MIYLSRNSDWHAQTFGIYLEMQNQHPHAYFFLVINRKIIMIYYGIFKKLDLAFMTFSVITAQCGLVSRLFKSFVTNTTRHVSISRFPSNLFIYSRFILTNNSFILKSLQLI